MKPFLPALILLLVSIDTVVGQVQELKVDFEAVEGYVSGTTLLGAGWIVEEDSGAVISSEGAVKGTQALRINPGSPVEEVRYVQARVTGSAVRFVEIWLKPVAKDPAEAEVTVNAWGSSFGFVKGANGLMRVAVIEGDSQTARAVETNAAFGEDGVAHNWLRLTLRQDPQAKIWDIFVDGRLVAINVSMGTEVNDKLVLSGDEEAAVSVDGLSVDEKNPLFTDTDGDGMPDAEEVANGLNPHISDRSGDVDGDGVSNIAEMLAGTSPRIAGAAGSGGMGGVLYVDNFLGNDINSGLRSYVVGDHGPKASIKSAMASAKDGDIIVIMKGTGTYDEGAQAIASKQLTIIPLNAVTIK